MRPALQWRATLNVVVRDTVSRRRRPYPNDRVPMVSWCAPLWRLES